MADTTPFDPNLMWSRPVVIYDGFTDNEPKQPAFTDEMLVEFLTTFPDPGCDVTQCVGKNCPIKMARVSWSPAVYVTGATRDDDNVVALNYACFDLDKLARDPVEQIEEVMAGLDALGYEYVVHTTHSHQRDAGYYRLVFPLSRPVEPSEWSLVHGTIIKVLELPADPLADLSRLYAAPTQRKGVPPFSRHRRGKPLDVDEALEVARQMGLAAPTRPDPRPLALPPTPAAPIDLAALREILVKVRRSKASGTDYQKEQAALLGKVLDGESLAPIGKRHNARIRVTGMIAKWVPPNTPWEAILELMRPCLVATDLDNGETFDGAVEKTRKLYEGSMVWRNEEDAKVAEVKAQVAALRDRVKGTAILTPEMVDDADPDVWMKLLLLTDGGNVRGCEHNAVLILACHPELRGTVRWNDVSKKIVVNGGPLADVPEDTLDVAAAAWMQRNCSFMGGAKLVRTALLQVARQNSYDPIAEYLNELGWDDTPRIDDFLEKYCGAIVDSPDKAKYVRAVSRRWLISLVARALRPGCKVDTVLILEGEQGIKKSTALEALVGSQYFLDTAIAIGEKDAMQAIAGAWLVELGELASLRRAEVDKTKQFMSSKVDKFRPPFGAVVVESPRRSVFVGTTNPDGGGYLKDRTGNRRYWPVLVGKPDVAAIVRDRDQILAEAVAAFKLGQRWWLDGEEIAMAAKEADERLEDSLVAEAVVAWWYGMKPGRRPKRVTMTDVTRAVLGIEPVEVTHAVKIEVGRAMKDMGFSYQLRRGTDGRTRYYEASDELMAAPERTPAMRAAGMDLVKAVKGDTKDGGQ